MKKARQDWKEISRYAGPQASPGFNLWRDFMRWQRGLNSALRPLGLTQPQFAVLAIVGWMTRDDAVITQQDLVDFLRLDRMHISQMATRLEDDGRLERIDAPHDKRAKQLRLTVQGQSLLAQAMPLVEAFDADFFSENSAITKG
jgi:DNA-binding MarR family transcriptional regulator